MTGESTGRSEPETPKSRRRRWVMRIAKAAIAIAVTVGLFLAARSAIDQWNQQTEELRSEIRRIDKEIAQTDDRERADLLQMERRRIEESVPRLANLRWRWLALAVLLYGASLVPPGFLLHGAMRSLGQRTRLSTAVAAQLIGHLGKYVPGKAMVVVLRSGALAKDGASILASTVSVFMETLLMMAVGAAVAAMVVCWLPVPGWLTVMAVLMAVGASLPTLPPILRIAASRVTKSQPTLDSKGSIRLFAAGWFYSLMSWLLIGGAFTSVVYAIPSATALPGPAFLYALSTAAISLAMVAGFASLLPGGAGVRELVLTTILGVSLGPAHGLLAAIAARMVFIVAEAILSLFAWLWLRRNSQASA